MGVSSLQDWRDEVRDLVLEPCNPKQAIRGLRELMTAA